MEGWPAHPHSLSPRGHGLGDDTLESELLLLQILTGGVLNLELRHCVAEGRLNLLLLTTLELHGHCRVRDNLFDACEVGLKLLTRFEFLGECLVAGLELGGIWRGV